MTDQLILPLEHRINFLVSDLIIGSFNNHAVQWLKRWPEWPLPKIICFYGPKGCGKTFLASLWKQHTQAFEINRKKALEITPFEVCAEFCNVLIDDAHLIEDSSWLYNLFNLTYSNPEISILLTSENSPKQWPKIPDLTSRIASTTSIEIQQPHDNELKSIILKFFHHRGLEVSANTVQFLLNHMDRTLENLQSVCIKLDLLSKSAKRPITIPFIQENSGKIFDPS